MIRRGKQIRSTGHIEPMLCTLVKEPPDNDEYLFEVKWDGYRILSFVDGGNVFMNSRSGLNYTSRYPAIEKALKRLKHDVVLDGEVVVFNKEGNADFDALQLYNGHNSPIKYCVFDLLKIDGKDITKLPLIQRKDLLKALLGENDVLQYSESFENGKDLYKKALEADLEGIVAKSKYSAYSAGSRGNDWLKIPTRKRQEFVIGGWAESDTSRSFKSLLFGAYENGKLNWIGRSGGGYKNHEMPGILKQLKALEVETSPFHNKILDTKSARIHYVKPELVANFEFATWTKSGRIRKPATFLGFRKDKSPKDVVREVPKETSLVEQEHAPQSDQENLAEQKELSVDKQAPGITLLTVGDLYPNKSKNSHYSNWKAIFKEPVSSQGTIEVDGHDVLLTNIEKKLWPDTKKADLISYYNTVSELILPYLKGRPLSLHIKQVAAKAPGLYIKDMEGNQPGFVDIFTDKRRIPKPGKRNFIDYAICNNKAALLYFVNLGCIDFNPWSARSGYPGMLDYISIDLDPGDDDFQKVISTALAVKEVLRANKLHSVVKTSGKTGLHIYLPCTGFDNAVGKSLGRLIYNQVNTLAPEITTDVVSVDKREGKVYVDYTLNDYADTLACAYSVRPHHIPGVSTPLEWKEINQTLHPADFTIKTVLKRFEKKGDLFAGLFNEKYRKENSRILRKMLV